MPRRPLYGQFMTPEVFADLVASEVCPSSQFVLDLASGQGALLEAVSKRYGISGIGIDLDERFSGLYGAESPLRILTGDGLDFDVASLDLPKQTAVVGNPPFGILEPRPQLSKILETAFPTLANSSARHKAEVYFLARSLTLAATLGGSVCIVLPITFAAGESLRPFRRALMDSWYVEEVIELPVGSFTGTEARTVILRISQKFGADAPTIISAYDANSRKVIRVMRALLNPGDRLDAHYHAVRRQIPKNLPTLGELGVEVERGRVSRKWAECHNLQAVHTTDLRRWKAQRVSLPSSRLKPKIHEDHVIAGPGDILLARTGSRVSWKPVRVTSGMAPITDHVFRVRIPLSERKRVHAAFADPRFLPWVEGMTTGVCAAVLAKKDLMEMPIFGSYH